MGALYLPDYIENATFHLERFVPRLAARTLGWREIQEMTTVYRQRGVCSLLLHGTAEHFHINMMQSAAAFIFFLQGCAEDEKVTSQVKPFLDALCGGYMDAADAIARNSRQSVNPDSEYEEDFLYASFLLNMVSFPSSADRCQALVDKFEAVHTAGDATRLEICRSLLANDSAAFNAALAVLLETRRERLAAMVERGALSEELASWLQPFASEGLALIRIAERLGVATEDHYTHVPEQARTRSPYTFDVEAWRSPMYAAKAV